MNMPKKVLVLGATGAMGQYLVPELANMGYQVDAVSLDADSVQNRFSNVRYIQGDAGDLPFLFHLFENRYDGIVDFMIYASERLIRFLPLMLDNTGHYIYLSSYRVYDNLEVPVRESSPRLLDSSENVLLKCSDDYSICKARGEDVIRAAGKKMNWTIIRPSITYSRMRYQLVTLEAPNTVGRAFAGKKVVLPEQARNVDATMTWAGDNARMIARLLFRDGVFGEAYNMTTAEHRTWGEIADYYKDICNLDAVWVDKEDYIRLLCPDIYNPGCRWQLEYDRLFTRIMDNSKLLNATGMSQCDLKPLYDGLKYEIERCPKDTVWRVNTAMDEYVKNHFV